MTRHTNSKRYNSRRALNIISSRSEATQVNHTTNNDNHDQVHVLELLENLGQFNEEIRFLRFLRGSAPLLVDSAEVTEDRESEVEGQTAEEDGEHGHPFEVFEKGTEEGALAKTVAEDG